MVSSDEEEQEDTTETTSPLSPPDNERGHKALTYQPKSPQCPPPSEGTDSDEYSSMPCLETPRDNLSPIPKRQEDSGYETQGSAPADANQDIDHFKDKDRQKELTSKLSEHSKAPWQHDPSAQAISEAERISKNAKPVYDGFWQKSDEDILSRLDAAARELKDRRTARKQDGNDSRDTGPTATTTYCGMCDEPLGHHVLQCTRENIQDTLKAKLQQTPIEPLTGPPKVIHPFPTRTAEIMPPPPPGIPAKFPIKLNSVAKMRTGPSSKEMQMLAAITTQPKVIIKELPQRR